MDERTSGKRRRIVEAARFLVLRHGLRGTTMEAIAREARIAKPTLYAHFPDKDAIFVGIVDELMDELLAAYDEGMQGPGELPQRIGAALAGQYAVLHRTLEASPHATDLMSEHKRLGMRFREKDLRTQGEVASELQSAGVADAEALTRTVLHAAYGIAIKAREEAEMTAGIKLLCRRLIGPELE